MIQKVSKILKKSITLLPKFGPKIIQQLVFIGAGTLLMGLFIKLSFNMFFDAKDARLLQSWDDLILIWIGQHRSLALTRIAVDLTSLGSSTVVGLLVAIFILVFAMVKDWFAVIHLIAVSLGAGSCALAFKELLERARPTTIAPLVEVTGFSFPSGHSLAATAIYLTFAILSARHFTSVKQRAAIFLLAAFVSLLIGLTRIYLGVHYPTDVASGMLLGSALAFLAAAGTLELTRRIAE